MNSVNKKKLILISLNELNFDLIDYYIDKYQLKSLKKLKKNLKITSSEKSYNLLEPWIQWLTIYNGKKANEHKIIRLGDGVNCNFNSIFKDLEDKGISVGAISPMNIGNNLKTPKYFLPDPWTETKVSGGFWFNLAHSCISNLTKDNARKNSNIINFIKFIFVFIKFASLKNTNIYFDLFFKSLRKKWFKPLFLDFFLHDIHMNLIENSKVNFSNIFFNSIAHIQHHYFYNSKVFNEKLEKNPEWYVSKNDDPLRDSLIVFDKILDDYVSDHSKFSIIIATGLSQIPYDVKKFYYRLRNHEKFFNFFNLKFTKIQELMSRDFIIEFENELECELNQRKILEISTTDNKRIFGDTQKMGNKLFLSFIFNEEINEHEIEYKDSKIKLKNFVDFVAIKNGMHNEKGFLYSNLMNIPNELEIHEIKKLILNYYDAQIQN